MRNGAEPEAGFNAECGIGGEGGREKGMRWGRSVSAACLGSMIYVGHNHVVLPDAYIRSFVADGYGHADAREALINA